MASPVDTTVKHFYSSMPGAPVLNGVAGSMVALLDACLVTGWGLKSATSLTVAGGVATLAFSGTHAAVKDAVILVEGVTGALTALNGEQKITAVGSGTVSFATAAADGTAAGTVTFKMAPAGWEKVFSGTNKAVYRSLHAQSTKMLVRFDDAGTTRCQLRGYETMSDVDTGAGMFPTTVQMANAYMAKSVYANTNPVSWCIVADARGAYVNVYGNSAYDQKDGSGRTVFLGDFKSFRTGGDAYAFAVGGSLNPGDTQTDGTCDGNSIDGCYAPRAYHGIGSSAKVEYRSEIGGSSRVSGQDDTYGQFPGAIDGGLRLSRRMVQEAVSQPPRGVLPGLYTVPQAGLGGIIAPKTVMPGTGTLSGRRILAIGCGANQYNYPSQYLGISFIDIVGPWDR